MTIEGEIVTFVSSTVDLPSNLFHFPVGGVLLHNPTINNAFNVVNGIRTEQSSCVLAQIPEEIDLQFQWDP